MTDLAFLRKFTKDNPKKISRYIKLYLGEAEKTFAALQESLAAQDWEQLKVHAHSLKPQAELMGLTELHQLLIQMEQKAAARETSALANMVDQARSLHVAAIPVLEKHT